MELVLPYASLPTKELSAEEVDITPLPLPS